MTRLKLTAGQFARLSLSLRHDPDDVERLVRNHWPEQDATAVVARAVEWYRKSRADTETDDTEER